MDDLDRIVDHLRQHEADAIEARIEQIITALDVLADNPLIGRPAGDELRELGGCKPEYCIPASPDLREWSRSYSCQEYCGIP